MSYMIVRMHMHGSPEVRERGLTLEEAQAHCNDPETSASTCTEQEGLDYTEAHGPWFDGYEEE
jgi:hypothetical protein